VLAGFLMLSYDQRTDDTGVEAALLVGACLGWLIRRGSRAAV